MTTKEVVARDLMRAARNLKRARSKKGCPPEEIRHMEELLESRREIARVFGVLKEV